MILHKYLVHTETIKYKNVSRKLLFTDILSSNVDEIIYLNNK